MKKLLSLAALSLLAVSPVSAQGIAGTWVTEFDRMVRNEGGVVTSGEKTRAKISLVQNGDSLLGTWQVVDNAPNMASNPRPLKGTIAGNKVQLQSEFKATINRNGETEERTVTVIYDLTLNGDKLEGTMTNRSGDMDMPARPFSAWRDAPAKQ